MSGTDVKRQVDEQLVTLRHRLPFDERHPMMVRVRAAEAALAPCTILTAEERETVLRIARSFSLGTREYDVLLALLTPEIFAPRDPHTYVTHEPPSSEVGGALPCPSDGTVHSADPAPDQDGTTCDECGQPSTHSTTNEGSRWNWCDDHPHRPSGYTVEDVREQMGEVAPDDIGPPAPGEGDDLPNPEIGMEC